jgi:hypothetical protein
VTRQFSPTSSDSDRAREVTWAQHMSTLRFSNLQVHNATSTLNYRSLRTIQTIWLQQSHHSPTRASSERSDHVNHAHIDPSDRRLVSENTNSIYIPAQDGLKRHTRLVMDQQQRTTCHHLPSQMTRSIPASRPSHQRRNIKRTQKATHPTAKLNIVSSAMAAHPTTQPKTWPSAPRS